MLVVYQCEWDRIGMRCFVSTLHGLWWIVAGDSAGISSELALLCSLSIFDNHILFQQFYTLCSPEDLFLYVVSYKAVVVQVI